ncbi:GntR family transcriptional regulator [Thermodesulfobacteriota bacterium]
MLEVPNSANFQAYQLIKKKIIRNELDPRQRVTEMGLAKELNFSRTPIREALIMLEKDELITRNDRDRGFYLKQYSLKDVYNLYEFREIIEVYLAGRVIENATEQDIEELEAILLQAQSNIDQGRPAEAFVKSLDFHLYCTQICTTNSFTIKSLHNCYEKLVIVSWTRHDLDAYLRSAREHTNMLDALKNRDINQFVECTRKHIRGARDRIMDTLQVDADKLYFVR